MQDHGERLQYSVFLCDLTVAKRAELEGAVTARHGGHGVAGGQRGGDRPRAGVRTSRGALPRASPRTARHRTTDRVTGASGAGMTGVRGSARAQVRGHAGLSVGSVAASASVLVSHLSRGPVSSQLRGRPNGEP